MDLKIDFNNPHILRGYLEQALPQIAPREFLIRQMTIGKEGGLAYRLFNGSEWRNVPEKPRMHTRDEIKLVKNYFGALETYIQTAEEHAKEHDFGLVYVKEDDINPTLGVDYPLFSVGMGDVSIGSVEKFERFMQMLKSPGMDDLKMLYANVTDAIGALHEKE